MLFSILIGGAATLYFVARALVIKLKTFAGRTPGNGRGTRQTRRVAARPWATREAENPDRFDQVGRVVYCEGRQYWAVFAPVLAAFEERGIDVAYLTGTEDDPAFTAGYRHVHPECIGQGNRAFARLNLLSADVVLMTTPGLDVYQLKHSRGVGHYAHLLHAPSDATMYRLFGLDYFDSVLLPGDYQGADIRALETRRGLPPKELVTVGCTYLDGAAQKLRPTEPQRDGRTVLVSPSWGPSGLLSRFGAALLDPLAATGWTVLVRPHPQSLTSEKAVIDALTTRYRDRANVEWDTKADNLDALSRADVMISDFSGIIYDYAFLRDRPILYVSQGLDLRPYDADDLGEPGEANEDKMQRLWQFRTLRKIGIELREEMFPRIAEVIGAASDSPSLAAARAAARKEAWQHPGEAGGRIVDFMIAHGMVGNKQCVPRDRGINNV
jgi:hypothetical protein